MRKDWLVIVKIKVTMGETFVVQGPAVRYIWLKTIIVCSCCLTATYSLKTANQSLQMTLLFIMMQHHAHFGNNGFCSSDDANRTNIH